MDDQYPPEQVVAYLRDPYAYLAQVLPAPKIVLQRGPKPDPESQRTLRLARERDRMREVRAKAKA